jgi:hypothetical protein
MHKFHSIAALCGDGLRPELRALFERLAIDPRSGLRIRHDGMIQKPAQTPLLRHQMSLRQSLKELPDLSLTLTEVGAYQLVATRAVPSSESQFESKDRSASGGRPRHNRRNTR